MKAWHAAAQSYTIQYGVLPSKIDKQGHDVNAFPPCAEPVVMQALCEAYCESTAGNAQKTLEDSLCRL